MARRLSFDEFCLEVQRTVRALPDPFLGYLENMVVDVEEMPTAADLATIDAADDEAEPAALLGLFRGTPLTEQAYGEHSPNRITIFRRPIEALSRSRRELRAIIRDTVLHELAHHFGYSEADLEPFEERRWSEDESA